MRLKLTLLLKLLWHCLLCLVPLRSPVTRGNGGALFSFIYLVFFDVYVIMNNLLAHAPDCCFWPNSSI